MGIYLVLFSGYFSVKTVQVQGAHFASSEQIQALVPTGHDIWFLSTRDITDRVMQYPSVQSATVQRGLPNSVRIVVREKQPALIWISGNTCYVLDASGTAFAQFSRVDIPELGVPRVYDVENVPVKLGQQVAGISFVQFVTSASEQFASLLPQVTINSIEISDTTYEVTFYSTQGLTVEMSSLSDAGVQVRNLTRLIHQKDATLTSNVNLTVDRWAYVN